VQETQQVLPSLGQLAPMAAFHQIAQPLPVHGIHAMVEQALRAKLLAAEGVNPHWLYNMPPPTPSMFMGHGMVATQ